MNGTGQRPLHARARGLLRLLVGLVLLTGLSLLLKLSGLRSESAGEPMAQSDSGVAESQVVAPLTTPQAQAIREAAVAATAPAETGLTVRVIDEHDQPVARARVLLFDSSTPQLRRRVHPVQFRNHFGRPWLEATTDAAGSARFNEPNVEQRDLVTLAEEHLPVYTRRDPLAPIVRVLVEQATTLHGSILVDGAAPTEPIALELRCFPDPSSEWGAGVRNLLRCVERAADSLSLTTAPDGSFAVRGLPRGLPRVITAPPCFSKSDGSAARFGLAAEVERVTLELSRAPSVVVRARTRPESPLAEHTFELEARFLDGGGGTLQSVRTSLSRTNPATLSLVPGLSALDLWVRDAETGRRLAHREELQPARVETIVLDVPELERSLLLQVQDPLGNAVAEATARGGEHEWRSTAADGRIVLDLCVELRSLVVGAPGHAAVEVQLPSPLPERMLVTLPRPTRVQLDVAGLDPATATGFGVHVGNASRKAYPRELLSGSPPAELDANGRWTAEDLPAGMPLTLSLQDSYGFELQRLSLELQPGEERELSCTIASQPRNVMLRVTDAEGAPLEGAVIRVARSVPRLDEEGDARTDVDGRACLRRVLAPDPEIEVQYDRMSTRRLPLSAACAADVRLCSARTLVVQVQGPADLAGRDLDLRLSIPGDPQSPYRAMHQIAGIHVFEGVPRKAGVVHSARRGREVAVDADATEVSLVLQP